jgi:hypothetical protein
MGIVVHCTVTQCFRFYNSTKGNIAEGRERNRFWRFLSILHCLVICRLQGGHLKHGLLEEVHLNVSDVEL